MQGVVNITGFAGDDFEGLLGETRRALEGLRATNGGTGSSSAEPVHGEGMAADGKVTARVVAGGRLEGLSVDPRMMRLGSEELCEQIMVAWNVTANGIPSRSFNWAATSPDMKKFAWTAS